jgi:uncharacterized protein YcsI (UPF0317 family)
MNSNRAPKTAQQVPSAISEVRHAIRASKWWAHTSGLARGYAQGNVVILREDLAFGFQRFCQRNPNPCPLLAVSEPGPPLLPELGEAIDSVDTLPGELRVFWACGVTPQAIVTKAKPEFCITHAPGYMLASSRIAAS